MPENVLVTGGAGFVGSHAAEYYAEQGASVTIFDNMKRVEMLHEADETLDTPAYNLEFLQTEYPEIEVIEGDVRNRREVENAVAGKDGIVHVAGQVSLNESIKNPVRDFEVNAEGTLNVLEAAKSASTNPPVAMASTNQVYGQNVNDIPIRETETRYEFDDPEYEKGIPEDFPIDHTTHGPYGVSKLAGDMYVQDYDARGEVDAAAFRMSCIYGTRQFGNEDQGWVAHFALSTLRDQPFRIFGTGKQVRDVLYVSDLIRAYDAFLSDPDGKSSVYNMGGGPSQTTSLLEFIDLIEELTGIHPDYSYEDWWDGDQRIVVSDISRAKAELDWEPTVSFEEGLRKYLDWAEGAKDFVAA